jgi:hypothetical protein
MNGTSSEPLVCPFVVLCDKREKLPFPFANLRADARQGHRPLVVTLKPALLDSGDYSIECDGVSYAGRVAVERKSAGDLYGTLGQHRERFERELARLNALEYAAVVVEDDWTGLLVTPPDRSQLNPLTVFRSVVAWQQRFARVHWWACPGRTFAERVCFRVLERFYRDKVEEHGKKKIAPPRRPVPDDDSDGA